MKYDRQQEMLAYLRENHSAKNEELLERFGVSIQTLRRDLETFEKQGLVEKVYGGVIYNDSADFIFSTGSFEDRNAANSKEKEYIAKLAASLIEENDVIFIDSGSTVYRILHYLNDVNNVTVMSHSLDVMNSLKEMPNLTAICLGGVLNPKSNTFEYDANFYPFNYSKAFIATVGISTTRLLTNTSLNEGAVKAHIIEKSSKNYIVADHSKFDVTAYNQFADFSKITAVITDCQPPEQFERFFESQNVELIY